MFYQCPKCKSRWQQPIPKCPNCFVAVERMKSDGAKVIGSSRVTIPTLLHPKVPYFALVLEDKQGNKWAQKSIKEYKIGEEVYAKPTKSQEAVAVWRVKYDILEAIEKIIELNGGIKVDRNSKIIILPTLVLPSHPHLGENTDPRVLDAMIKFLIRQGAQAKNIKIVGQSFNEIPIEVSAGKSRFLEVAEKNKVSLLDLSKTEFTKQSSNNFNFWLSAELFKQDLIINLPTLNLHPKLGVAGATENVFKFLDKRSYLALKYLFANEQIFSKIYKALPKNILTIGEAMSVQKTNKLTAFLSIVLSGHNMLNIDRVFAEICMLSPLPNYMRSIKMENIPLTGREIEEVQFNVESI